MGCTARLYREKIISSLSYIYMGHETLYLVSLQCLVGMAPWAYKEYRVRDDEGNRTERTKRYDVE